MFDGLKRLLGGVSRQVNPFDNGATWSSPRPQVTPPRPRNRPPSRAIPLNATFTEPVQQSGNFMHINQRVANPNIPLQPTINDGLRRGNRLLGTTAQVYRATPAFEDIIRKTKPLNVGGARNSYGLSKGAQAAGTYNPRNERRDGRIWVADRPNKEPVLHHEGLHAVWDNLSPKEQSEYIGLLERVTPPNTLRPAQIPFKPRAQGLRAYLDSRTSSYKGKTGSAENFLSLNPDIQNEVHSYVPEYYENFGGQMPAELAAYYSRYYRPGEYRKRQQFIQKLTPPRPNRFGGILGALASYGED